MGKRKNSLTLNNPTKRSRLTYTTERFIEKAKAIHGNTYDYSKVVYINAHTKIKIICSVHGEFEQTPTGHIHQKSRCSKCALENSFGRQKYTTDEFIQKAKEVHKNKYDYSEIDYTGVCNKVTLTCLVHGKFQQVASNHLGGHGCSKCSYDKNRKTKEQFIAESEKIFGKKYDYSEVKYIDNNTKVILICPIHGKFEQLPRSHLNGHECFQCANDIPTTKQFIIRAIQIHGDKYDYSNVVYINNSTKIKLICSVHGEFEQTPTAHIDQQCGCPKCGIISSNTTRKWTTEEFITNAEKIHGKRYNYEEVEYLSSRDKVTIICKKHGRFLQTPNSHVDRKSGCPQCKQSHMEREMSKILDNLGTQLTILPLPWKLIEIKSQIIYENGKVKPDHVIKIERMNDNKIYTIIIEMDGAQHFEPVMFNSGDDPQKKFLDNQRRDQYKEKYYMNHNMFLLRIDHTIKYRDYQNTVGKFINQVCETENPFISKIGSRYNL